MQQRGQVCFPHANQQYVVVALSVLQAAIALAIGLGGNSLRKELSMPASRLFVAALLLILTVLAVTLCAQRPRQPMAEHVAFTIPLHWSASFQIALVAGLALGFWLVQLFGDQTSFSLSHTYEVVGLAIGALFLLVLGFRREALLKAGFAIGYGLGLSSAILMLDPSNNVATITYGGHLIVMLLVATFAILFGRLVRVRIVD